jgi:hypothetical protein
MADILSLYLQNRLYVVLHALVGALGCGLLAIWQVRLNRARGEAVARPPRSDVEFHRIVDPMGTFDTWFDFCSSAFIFVGLLGTILGFASAIPFINSLDSQDERFMLEVRRAMATSGAGILLSIAFNLLVLALEAATVRPFVEGLRRNLQGSDLELSIKEHIEANTRILSAALGEFRTGIQAVVESVDRWNTNVGALLVGFDEISRNIQATAERFAETYRELQKLPGELTGRFREIFDEGAASLAASLHRMEEAVGRLERLPGRVERAIDESFERRRQALDEIAARQAQGLESAFSSYVNVVEEALEKYRGTLTAQGDAVQTALATLSGVPAELAEKLRLAHQAHLAAADVHNQESLEQFRQKARAIVETQIRELVAAAQRLEDEGKGLRGNWEKIYEEDREALREAIRLSLQEATELVDRQRENLAKIEGAWPEGMAATFEQLIGEMRKAVAALNQAVVALAATAGSRPERPEAGRTEPFQVAPAPRGPDRRALGAAAAAGGYGGGLAAPHAGLSHGPVRPEVPGAAQPARSPEQPLRASPLPAAPARAPETAVTAPAPQIPQRPEEPGLVVGVTPSDGPGIPPRPPRAGLPPRPPWMNPAAGDGGPGPGLPAREGSAPKIRRDGLADRFFGRVREMLWGKRE